MDDKTFLLALRDYIEQSEEFLESERGMGRSLKELISEDQMPDVYAEVLRRLGDMGGLA